MNIASRICIGLSVITFLLALIGRYFGSSLVHILGDAYSSTTLLSLTNTLLLAAVLFIVLKRS